MAATIAIVFSLAMVFFPAIALNSAKKGFDLWVGVVLPALLPFFICANFMVKLGIPSIIGRFFENFFQKMFGVPGSSAFVFIVSISSGYPMGPKVIGDLVRRGEITNLEAEQMLTFCSTSGPLFMLGAVGIGMLHSPQAGVVIALAHYMGALLNGIAFHLFSVLFHRKNNYRTGRIRKYRSDRFRGEDVVDLNLMNAFTESVLSAMKTLGIICCYIILFMMATDFMDRMGLLSVLKADYAPGLIKGMMEMTVGSNAIAGSMELGIKMKCVIITFLISFGGLSTLAQSISVLEGATIRAGKFVISKLTHGIFASFVAYAIFPHIFNQITMSVGAFGFSTWTFDAGALSQLLFSTKMIIMILFLFIFSVAIDQKFARRRKSSE